MQRKKREMHRGQITMTSASSSQNFSVGDFDLDYTVYPTYIFDFNPGDELTVEFRILYNGKGGSVRLDRIENLVPVGFTFADRASMGSFIKNSLILGNKELPPLTPFSVRVRFRLVEPLGNVKYQPKLLVKVEGEDAVRVLLFPLQIIRALPFEDFPPLKEEYLQPKLNLIERTEPGV